jgi:putative hydrolase of the HAD superfamily
MKPAVLFDLDGTLVDHEVAAKAAVVAWSAEQASGHGLSDRVLTEHWLKLEDEQYARYLDGSASFEEQRRARLGGFLRFLGQPARPESELDALFSVYLRHYEASWRAYDDVVPALTDLRRSGVAMGVLTNGQEAQQRAKLAAVQLLGEFECVVASSTLTAAKPAPEAFVEACRRLGRLPGEVVYVGDNLQTDALAARSAGLRGIWLDRRGVTTDAATCETLTTLRDLPKLLALGQ